MKPLDSTNRLRRLSVERALSHEWGSSDRDGQIIMSHGFAFADHNRPKLQRIDSQHASTGKLRRGNLTGGFMNYLKATDRIPANW